MPADFDKCVRDDGRVVTKKVGKNKFMHICWDKSGKSHAGEVKVRKAK